MSYQVLARKWRPRRFDELVGQEHVRQALVNALDQGRLHHALLFTGTRGVGKTTIARILAKCLNCERGVSSKPCGECTACRGVDEGRCLDLIEVDAASRTKVEDTRELLENVQYAPTRARYKVYLIDEVHMLSAHSFNALLKTLEEPPPHVKFLLATTDPQRLPVTVLSRCLQFNLKRLPQPRIEAHLAHILAQEGLSGEPAALCHIARAADGSMRDALSLLDQAVAFGGGDTVCEHDVRSMLGTVERGYALALLKGLADGNALAVLEEVERLAEQTPDFPAVLSDVLSLLTQIARVQIVPESCHETSEEIESIRALARALSPEDVQLFYQIALIGRRDLPLAPDPRGGFEMVLLRMLVFRPAQEESTTASEKDRTQRDATHRQTKALTESSGHIQAETVPAGGAASAMPLSAQVPQAGSAPRDEWIATVDALKLTGLAHQIAANSRLERHEGGEIHLLLDETCVHMRNKNAEQRLEQALKQHYGTALRLVIHTGVPNTETPAQQRVRLDSERRQQALAAIERDPTVQAIKDTFGAQIHIDSIEPLH
jgi:DNA polymerase III, subunit gamma and tau